MTIGAKSPFVNGTGLALTLEAGVFTWLINPRTGSFHNICPFVGLFGQTGVDFAASLGLELDLY